MQALILAAGMATRLQPLTNNTPKCLLKLGDRPILDFMLSNLINQNITNLVMVTGFEALQIENFVKEKFPQINTIFVRNPDFANTNNAYSLLLAKKHIHGEFLLLDSDIIFDTRIIQSLKDFPSRPVLAANVHPCGEEEIKVTVDSSYKIKEISKQVHPEKAFGESIGIELFCPQSAQTLFQVLEKRMAQEKRLNEFYEASFEEMIKQGNNFYACDVTHLPAMEIDFIEDLEKAQEMVKNF